LLPAETPMRHELIPGRAGMNSTGERVSYLVRFGGNRDAAATNPRGHAVVAGTACLDRYEVSV